VRVLRRLKVRWWLVVGAVVVVVAAGATWFTTRDSTAAAQTTTATVSSGTYKATVSATGTVAAAKEADLDFAATGTVTRVLVAEGDKVTKGQVLATVGRASSRASLAAARSSLTAATTQLDDDVDADATDTQLTADRAAVLSAKSTVGTAEDDLASTRLRSTMAGTVASVDVQVGDQVSGGTSSQSGGTSGSSGGTSGGTSTGTGTTGGATTTATTTSTSAVTVVSTKAYVVDATVASSDIKQVKKGLQAQVTVTGVDATVYGTVSTVGLVAQTSSSGAAEFPVTIAVTGTPKGLYAGSSATASIVVKQVTNVLTVPTQALHTSGKTTYVTQVVGGKNVRTPVVTGTAYGFATQVRSGLKSGDKVVLATFTRIPGTGTRSGSGASGRSGFPEGGVPGGGQGFGGGTGGGFGGGFGGGGQ
jgi:multidrug efflux pump subunit AcrA (membrane-fusion protein)